MSQNLSFTCPACYSEVAGTLGATLTCGACNCEFNAAAATAVEDDELTLAPLNETVVAATVGAPTMAGSADATLHLEAEVSQSDHPCTKCKELIDVNTIECPHCGFNVTLGRKLDPAELDPYHGVFGFDRYLMHHTQDNDTSGLMTWLHVFLGFVGIVTMLVLKSWAYFVIPTLAIIYGIYRVRANRAKSFQRGKGVIPKLLLLYNRLTGWKGFISNDHSDGCVLSMRSSQFDDNSIASIAEPETIEVLDIAGSSVTDNGVRYLATFYNLRVLVVENCTVGEDALDELQAAIPQVCIWRP